MFTIEQIKSAPRRVKSGADFPSYIKELGMTHYDAFLGDGQIDYHGANNYSATLPSKYNPLVIADTANVEGFKVELSVHQQGKTDFHTFIKCVQLLE